MGKQLSDYSVALRDHHPRIPWKQMAGLRDIIVHEYDGIDLDIIRDVVELELPNILPLLQDLTSGR
ncbi:MAG: HepT-like ribonuclease domain-containing protein [Phormidesmis sp.]